MRKFLFLTLFIIISVFSTIIPIPSQIVSLRIRPTYVFAQTPGETGKRFNSEFNASSEKLRGDSLNCKIAGGWFAGYCNTIFIDSTRDSIAYIGDGGYLRILNISDPESPIFEGELRCPGGVKDIYVVDTLAYVVADDSGFCIINVSDPNNPFEIGHYATEGEAQAVYLVDSLAYVADSDSGLRVLNLSDPISPFEIGCYPLDCFIGGLQVVDTVAYATVSADGLYIINFSNPANPYLAGFYYTGHHTYDVYVRDNLAYLTYGGIYIIDVSTPADLDEIGYCSLGIENYATNVKVIDTLAYATGVGTDLHIINVSDPTDPLEIGYYYLVGSLSL
jgi:hypothetical protein